MPTYNDGGPQAAVESHSVAAAYRVMAANQPKAISGML